MESAPLPASAASHRTSAPSSAATHRRAAARFALVAALLLLSLGVAAPVAEGVAAPGRVEGVVWAAPLTEPPSSASTAPPEVVAEPDTHAAGDGPGSAANVSAVAAGKTMENIGEKAASRLARAVQKMTRFGSHGAAILAAKWGPEALTDLRKVGKSIVKNRGWKNTIDSLDVAKDGLLRQLGKHPNLATGLSDDALGKIVSIIGKQEAKWSDEGIEALIKAGNMADGSKDLNDVGKAIGNGWASTTTSTKNTIQTKLTQHGMDIDEFNALKNLPVESLTPTQKQVFDDVWQALDEAQDTGMKFIPDPDAADLTIKGAAANYADASGLTNREAVETLRLDYKGSPFIDEVGDPIDTFYAVEFTKNPTNSMYRNKGYPGTGNGFTSSANGRISPEYYNARSLQGGDKLGQVTSSGMTDTGKVWSTSAGTWVFP